MIRDILVPIDGSAFSEHSLPTALELARRARARLHLVQVHETLLSPGWPPLLPVADTRSAELLRAQEEEYLAALANRCEERGGVRPRVELLDGVVSSAIAGYAAEMGIDLVVMTTHGRGGISRAWVGSVADALVRRVSVPVLLVRPKEGEPHWNGSLESKHVLIPLDGSALSESVLASAVALGSLTGARYTLLRIVLPLPLVTTADGPPIFGDAGARQAMADADVYLEHVAARVRAEGVVVNVHAMLHSMPALGILDFAATHAVDAIAMATHGRGGWSRRALGSIADKVMRGTSMPTLLYRPDASAANRFRQSADETREEEVWATH